MESGLSTTEYAVLGLLTIKPMSGYEMRQLVAESIGHFWSESYGQLYPSLKRLRGAGLVSMKSDKSSKRDKHIYSITTQGREALAAWLALPAKPQPPRSELLLKLFFLSPGDAATTIEQVNGARDRALEELRHLGFVEAKIRSENAGQSQLQQWLYTLHFGRHRAEAVVRWADEILLGLEGEAEARNSESKT